MTRDEEIEALAMRLYVAAPEDSMCSHPRECFRAAEDFFHDRDRWRAARQTAPETPTPRIEVLKRWLECCFELGIHGYVVSYDGRSSYLAGADKTASPVVDEKEFRQLYAYSATLKERKEKADA